jgi:hypothetical protein
MRTRAEARLDLYGPTTVQAIDHMRKKVPMLRRAGDLRVAIIAMALSRGISTEEALTELINEKNRCAD